MQEIAVALVHLLNVILEPMLQKRHQLGSDVAGPSIEFLLEGHHFIRQRFMFGTMGREVGIFVTCLPCPAPIAAAPTAFLIR